MYTRFCENRRKLAQPYIKRAGCEKRIYGTGKQLGSAWPRGAETEGAKGVPGAAGGQVPRPATHREGPGEAAGPQEGPVWSDSRFELQNGDSSYGDVTAQVGLSG